MDIQKIVDKLAYCGEQALSYLDEIVKMPCPQCGKSDLSLTFVGKALIIRCSEQLNAFNEEEGLIDFDRICDYHKVIDRVNINTGPFILEIGDKRATAVNRKVKRPPGRPKKNVS